MTSVRVGSAQIAQSTDIDENVRQALWALEEAARNNVQIVCLPEAHLAGYRGPVRPNDDPMILTALDDAHETLAKRCGELGLAAIIGTETPSIDNQGEVARPYNSAWFISEHGEIIAKHHKNILHPLDLRGYSPGTGFQVHTLQGVPCGVMICFEGFRFPQTIRAVIELGAKIVFHPHFNGGFPGLEWKQPVVESLEVARAAETTVWVIGANIADDHQCARSLVIAPDGQLRAASELGKTEVIYADIDPDEATHAMFNFDVVGLLASTQGDTLTAAEVAEVRSAFAAGK